jgi:acetyl esterase/lipase
MARRFGLLITLLLIAACGGSDAEGGSSGSAPETEADISEPAATQPATEPRATEPPASEPDVTEPDITEPGATQPAAISPWFEITPDSPDCACSDGSEFSFFERPGDPAKVMFYFEGGGACFNLDTCDPNGDPTYSTGISQTVDSLAGRGGLFDADNPENPLADHSIVYVPYCTGDVHLGNTTTEYSPDVVIEHRGAANANAALEYLVEQYADAEQVLVTGASAGSVPTPLVAGLTADALPDAEIITLGDSSGAYPDVPSVNELIGSLWGTENAIPNWPVNDGLTAADWGFPDIYVQAGRHAPDVTFARFDYAFDEVQATFAALAGVGADQVVEQIDSTEAQVEAGGVALAVYVAPGDEHTIISGDEVYDLEVEGVRLIDWITELVGGGVPADVHCVECTV